MKLTVEEQTLLLAYRLALEDRHPGAVVRMVIYGSKARGEASPDSDLDLLLIVKNDAAHLKRDLRRIGYLLAAAAETAPSILAYTETEWENRRKSGSAFLEAVERDAVPV